MTLLIVSNAQFCLIIRRTVLRQMKTTLEFDKDTAIFGGDGKKVTLLLCTDGGANKNPFSEAFTSGDGEYADSAT